MSVLSHIRETFAQHVSIASFKAVFLRMTVPLAMFIINVVVGGCSSNPCTNRATRVPVMPDTYSCECPENLSRRNCDETEFNGFKYLIVDEPQDWETARGSCVVRGYNLTSIETVQEIDFLGSFVG